MAQLTLSDFVNLEKHYIASKVIKAFFPLERDVKRTNKMLVIFIRYINDTTVQSSYDVKVNSKTVIVTSSLDEAIEVYNKY